MIDVHELAKLPHGEATKKLKENGLWDEWGGLPEKKFKANIEYTLRVEDEFYVKARHKDEAIKIVEDHHIPDNADCDVLEIDGEMV